MDAETLTQEAIGLPRQARLNLVRELQRSFLQDRPVAERLREMVDVMNALVGFDIRTQSRKRDYVRARDIVAYEARKEGYFYADIGAALNLHHSSVVVACRNMAYILDEGRPFYNDYYDLRENFKQKI